MMSQDLNSSLKHGQSNTFTIFLCSAVSNFKFFLVRILGSVSKKDSRSRFRQIVDSLIQMSCPQRVRDRCYPTHLKNTTKSGELPTFVEYMEQKILLLSAKFNVYFNSALLNGAIQYSEFRATLSPKGLSSSHKDLSYLKRLCETL